MALKVLGVMRNLLVLQYQGISNDQFPMSLQDMESQMTHQSKTVFKDFLWIFSYGSIVVPCSTQIVESFLTCIIWLHLPCL